MPEPKERITNPEPRRAAEEAMELTCLLEGCRHRDEAAWEAFLLRYGGRLYNMARKAARGERDLQPEDVVQEVLLRLLRRFTIRAESTGQIVNYLKRMVRTVVSDLYRRRTAAKRTWRESHETPPSTPEEELLQQERYRDLLKSLTGGTHLDRDRQIVHWAVVDDRSAEEIAAMVGLSPSGVASVLNRLRTRCRVDAKTGYRPQRRGTQSLNQPQCRVAPPS